MQMFNAIAVFSFDLIASIEKTLIGFDLRTSTAAITRTIEFFVIKSASALIHVLSIYGRWSLCFLFSLNFFAMLLFFVCAMRGIQLIFAVACRCCCYLPLFYIARVCISECVFFTLDRDKAGGFEKIPCELFLIL